MAFKVGHQAQIIGMDQMNDTIVLFTASYPYGNGETFLETEIEYLSNSFKKIIVCPLYGSDMKREVPSNVYVHNIFHDISSISKWHFYIKGSLFLIAHYDLLRKIKLTRQFHVLGPLRSIKYIGLVSILQKDIQRFLKKQVIDLNTTVFYTYWFGYVTLATGLIKEKNPLLKLISRAHRFDLYDGLGDKSLTFIKYSNLFVIDKLFCISRNGRSYLALNYPHFQSKYIVLPLGTTSPGFIVSQGNSDTFKIVSCSSIIPVKRLDRIIEALKRLSENYASIQLEWHHFGDGQLKAKMKEYAANILPPNIKCYFHGHLSNNDLFSYYKKLNPHVFINVSESEGVPVSIMEALSVGLPAIATNVGGNGEIVNHENGWLLSQTPDAEEISRAIYSMVSQKENWSLRSNNALKEWNEHFNAKKNYIRFVENINQI